MGNPALVSVSILAPVYPKSIRLICTRQTYEEIRTISGVTGPLSHQPTNEVSSKDHTSCALPKTSDSSVGPLETISTQRIVMHPSTEIGAVFARGLLAH